MWERLRDWVRERREKLNLFDETLVARQDNPMYLLGPLLYYFWLITVVTGVVLMIWYEPTTSGARTAAARLVSTSSSPRSRASGAGVAVSGHTTRAGRSAAARRVSAR